MDGKETGGMEFNTTIMRGQADPSLFSSISNPHVICCCFGCLLESVTALIHWGKVSSGIGQTVQVVTICCGMVGVDLKEQTGNSRPPEDEECTFFKWANKLSSNKISGHLLPLHCHSTVISKETRELIPPGSSTGRLYYWSWQNSVKCFPLLFCPSLCVLSKTSFHRTVSHCPWMLFQNFALKWSLDTSFGLSIIRWAHSRIFLLLDGWMVYRLIFLDRILGHGLLINYLSMQFISCWMRIIDGNELQMDCTLI